MESLELFDSDLLGNYSLPTFSKSYFVTEEATTPLDIARYVRDNLGEKRKDIFSVVFLTVVYSLIFVTGVVGNLSTCIVIGRNAYMHSVTNYYLLNLAISDMLILLLGWFVSDLFGNHIVGFPHEAAHMSEQYVFRLPVNVLQPLPPELYSIWDAYPWRFGEAFCVIKAFVMEMTSYSSVLTITGFTVERYIAICHPIKLHKACRASRALRSIVIIWAVSMLSALPYPLHTRIFYYLNNENTGEAIPESLVCSIPFKWIPRMITVFQISTFLYFVLPMIVITVFYILIGLKLRKSELASREVIATPQYGKPTAKRARRAVLRMLVAVVVAFFVCWAPFHAQRLMTLYVTDWTTELNEMHSHLFYVSGVLYFLSSTVNPILYNVLSRKFRQAFKRTLCRCCLNINSLPTFYKLKAKFINNDAPAASTASGNRYLCPEKNSMRMATFYRADRPKSFTYANEIIEPASTRDTIVNRTSRSSTCSSHAHSDGGLHYLCRHKRCLNRRQSSLSPRQNCNTASYQDIELLRQKDIRSHEPIHKRRGEQRETLSTFNSSLSEGERPILKITLQI